MKKLISSTIYLDRRRAISGTDKFPVKIKVSHNRTRKYYRTGYNMTEVDFESIILTTKRIKDKVLDIKTGVYKMKSKADEIISQMEDFTFYEFERLFLGKSEIIEKDVYTCYNKLINRSEISFSTKEIYLNSMRSLKKYVDSILPKNNGLLSFKVITADFIYGWVSNLKDEGKTNGTIGIYTRALRTVFNYGIDKKMISREHYPFGKKKFIPPTKSNVKKVLSKDILRKIIEAPLDPLSPRKRARDFFIMSYLWNGMNIADMLELKNRDLTESGISYYRVKTARYTGGEQLPIRVRFGSSWKEQMFELIEFNRSRDRRGDAFLFDVFNKGMSDEEDKEKFH